MQVRNVPLRKMFLAQDNPRHHPVGGEPEAIAKLCADEQVLELASDIVQHGLNPLELTGLLESNDTYIVMEGNRRVCALKLLTDPDRAPAQFRAAFEKYGRNWSRPISEVPSFIFPNRDVAKLWMGRIHNGAQDGIGRRNWNSAQKARNDERNKNRPALALLDVAEGLSLISADERRRKLTTVQRFVGNLEFQRALGIVFEDDQIKRNRPEAQFQKGSVSIYKGLIEGRDCYVEKERI